MVFITELMTDLSILRNQMLKLNARIYVPHLLDQIIIGKIVNFASYRAVYVSECLACIPNLPAISVTELYVLSLPGAVLTNLSIVSVNILAESVLC